MLHFLFSFFHVVVAILLIFIILIQANKGMGLAGAFGAVGAGENFLSTSGAFNILVKITTVLAIIFCVTSISLSYFPPPTSIRSVMEDEDIPVPQTLDKVIQSQREAPQAPAQ